MIIINTLIKERKKWRPDFDFKIKNEFHFYIKPISDFFFFHFCASTVHGDRDRKTEKSRALMGPRDGSRSSKCWSSPLNPELGSWSECSLQVWVLSQVMMISSVVLIVQDLG